MKQACGESRVHVDKERCGMKKKIKPFQVVNVLIMIFLIGITLYPMYYVVVASISDPILLKSHTGLLWKPLGEATLAGYQKTLANKSLFNGFKITLFYLIAGTLLQVGLTSFAAYVVSRKCFLIRRGVMKLMIFTMFFSGGMIPLFIIVNKLGLYDSRWSMILPVAVNAWNLIIARTYFQGLPEGLIESAKLDGANDFQVLWKIIIPLSKPILAVLALFSAVGHWNAYFNAVLFLPSPQKQPLQIYLQKLLINMSDAAAGNTQFGLNRSMQVIQLRYSTIIVVILPIICVYPFLQKYFVQGVMIGAIKE